MFQSDFLPGGTYNGVVTLPFASPVTLNGGTTYWIGISSVYGTVVGSSFSVQYSSVSSGFAGQVHGGSWTPTTGPAFALNTNLDLGGPSNYWGHTYTNQLNLADGIITAPSAISLDALFVTLPTGSSDPTAPSGSFGDK